MVSQKNLVDILVKKAQPRLKQEMSEKIIKNN